MSLDREEVFDTGGRTASLELVGEEDVAAEHGLKRIVQLVEAGRELAQPVVEAREVVDEVGEVDHEHRRAALHQLLVLRGSAAGGGGGEVGG